MFSWAWKGIGGDQWGIPRPLEFGKKVVKVSVGGMHALALSENGQVRRMRESKRARERYIYARRILSTVLVSEYRVVVRKCAWLHTCERG